MALRQHALPPVRHIGMGERSWASKRFQDFLGTFVLCPRAGFYFDPSMPDKDKDLILTALRKVPRKLVQTARELGLTMSTCEGLTPNGNSSTTYCEWSRSNLADGSPHIVMGGPSLNKQFVLPHLIHELCHLFFGSNRHHQAAWKALILKQQKQNVCEVTEYTQESRTSWLEERTRNAAYGETLLTRYMTEAFCETVAAILVPSYMHESCNVDLNARIKLIEQMELRLPLQ